MLCRFAALGLLFLALPARADIQIDLGRGPVNVRVPASYDSSVAAPLLMLLHGYSDSAAAVEARFRFAPLAEEFGFLYVVPEGLDDEFGFSFWNATDACCDYGAADVDDSAYLRALIEETALQLNVDDKRVWIAGHSNGGFMAHRMACDHPDIVAAIASVAGATWLDASECAASEPVHALQIHGTADIDIHYDGGDNHGVPYPSALQTAETWATLDSCTTVRDSTHPNIDLIVESPGAETAVTCWVDSCAVGGSAELWTHDAGHNPQLAETFNRSVLEWFAAHSKDTAVFVPVPPIAYPGILLEPPAPNPFVGDTRFAYFAPQRASVRLDIFDVRGRHVRSLAAPAAPLEMVSAFWDARDAGGKLVSPGIYFACLRAGSEMVARKVVVGAAAE